MFFIPLLYLHLLISIVFPPPPPLPHFYCFPSSSTSSLCLLFSLQVWSFRPDFGLLLLLLLLLLVFIVSPPPPPPPSPPHLYCFPSKRPKGQHQAYKAKLKCDGLIMAFWSFQGKTIEMRRRWWRWWWRRRRRRRRRRRNNKNEEEEVEVEEGNKKH